MMKPTRVLALVVLISIIFTITAQTALANVVYVADATTGTACDDLERSDKTLCNRIESLGFTVSVVNSNLVKNNPENFDSYADEADLIFIGDVPLSLMNTTIETIYTTTTTNNATTTTNNATNATTTTTNNVTNATTTSSTTTTTPATVEVSDFCQNVGKHLNDRGIIYAFSSTYHSDSTMGCAFQNGGFTFEYNDNSCLKRKLFLIEKDGYLTNSFETTDEVRGKLNLYTKDSVANTVSSGMSWISAECTPIPDTTGLFSVVATEDKTVFWGLEEVNNYDKTAFTLFDRTVLLASGGYQIPIDATIFPTTPSDGNRINIFIKKPEHNATIAVNFGKESIPVEFNNKTNIWENLGFKPNATGDLEITATADDGLYYGTLSTEITLGELDVKIISGDYTEEKYVVRASSKLNNKDADASLRYTIYTEEMNIVTSGDLVQVENIYKAIVNEELSGDLYLHIYGDTADGKVGGTFRRISKISEGSSIFGLDPEELVIFTKSPRNITRTIKLRSRGDYDLTGLSLEFSGDISSTFWAEQLPDLISSGDSDDLKIGVDLTLVGEGEYRGVMTLKSDQFSTEIPYLISYRTLRDVDWLEVDPIIWRISAAPGEVIEKTFTLRNTGLYPIGELSYDGFSGVTADLPSYIEAESDSEIIFKIDTSDLDLGEITKVIKLESTHGGAAISIYMNLSGQSLSRQLSDLEDRLAIIKTRIISLGEETRDMLQEDITDAENQLTDARNALDEGDTDSVQDMINNIGGLVGFLENQVGSSGSGDGIIVIAIVVIVLAIVVAAIYVFRDRLMELVNKLMKRFKKEEPKAEPEDDDSYRTDYY